MIERRKPDNFTKAAEERIRQQGIPKQSPSTFINATDEERKIKIKSFKRGEPYFLK